ncbi:type II toxin-antitoxin system YoeB family toxin [Lactobacillus ultunensis]|uniref:Putative addiction module toxin, Txe/YoeB family n=1 Tax=Lactobacillus ultunensis DSM 16047 TaxID=525365 RepID=C2ENB8_9LACO|nr:type II toxin-antitoxin system YoeB family toxin [Lactobacillus ultunensis]EEJ71922.1 putative addiction module toxin, Txe/YoeB family [Lactobacillus ultunensis DSM 16047]KRL82081.1 hypothetical protein FC57_GL000167 [Lactobacillus ultunensis DSM 16047]QQP27664.1 type II toxin-antitoxin system YoeB family toxin [Lactobacillus ultunensis]
MYVIQERNILKKHIVKLKRAGLLKNYHRIIDEIAKDPKSQTHHFEILERKISKPSIFSKRLSKSHRVVYSIDVNHKSVTIFSAWGHYASGVHSLDQHKL